LRTLKPFLAYAAALSCVLVVAAVFVHFLMKHEYQGAQTARLQIMLHQGEEVVEGAPVAPVLQRVLAAPDEGLVWVDRSGAQIASAGMTATRDAAVQSARIHEEGADGTLRATISNSRLASALHHLDLGLAIGTILAVLTSGLIITLISSRAISDVESAMQRVHRFTGDAAHELRTPLAVITNNADALAGDAGDEARERSLSNIRQAALQMRRLMDGLLILARADEGVVHDLHAIDVGTCVAGVAHLYRAEAAEKGITFRVRGGDAGQTIYGQPEQVARILGNLVENALRYTPSGGTVEIACTAERGTVVIDVTDTGVGIEAEAVDRIFDRFWRGRTSAVYGSGLGLAIARGLARAHGGDVSVQSRLGAGSTFRVRLPLRPSRPGGVFSTVS